MSFLRRFFRCYACEAKDAEIARHVAEKNEILDRMMAMIQHEFQTKFEPPAQRYQRPPDADITAIGIDPEFEPYLQRTEKTPEQLINDAAERLRAQGREIVPDY